MVKIDRLDVLKMIKDQNRSSGTIKVSDDLIALITGSSKRTIQRVLNDLEEDNLIERHTEYKTYKGTVMGDRYIVLTDPKTPRTNGFSTQNHINLSNRSNHRCKTYGSYGDTNATYEWHRCPTGGCTIQADGINSYKNQWELSMPDKDFKSCKQVYEYVDDSIKKHKVFISKGKKKINNKHIDIDWIV